MANNFTPSERAILDVLADGLSHHRSQLIECLPEETGTLAKVHFHLSLIRRRLRPIGQDIICELVGQRHCYRHIRLLASSHDGKR